MLAEINCPTSAHTWADSAKIWRHPDSSMQRNPGVNRHAGYSHRDGGVPRPVLLHAQVEQLVTQRTAELEAIIAELHTRQQQLEAQLHYDELTGLANRRLLQDRFQCAMERAKRNGDCFAVLMVDLDGFKAINDRYGHAVGDSVLVDISRRLLAAVRTCDTVARLGGDEFVLIIEAVRDANEVALVSRKLTRILSEAIPLECGTVVSVGASIGVGVYPGDGLDLADVLCVADKAMYTCKNTHRMGL